MQRSLFVILLGLSLAIGLTVGAMAWRTATFEQTVPDRFTADPAVGYAFYAGIEQVLADGNTAGLEQAVTGDFVDHLWGDDTSLSTDELVEQLNSFAATFPGTTIEGTNIHASGNSLVVTIAPIAPLPVSVAGMAMSSQPMGGRYELLRIHNGKVAERWSEGLPAISATTFQTSSYSLYGSASMAMRLDRTELPEGAELKWQSGRTAVLMVESGEVRVQLNWTDQREARDETVVVTAGETLAVASNKNARLERAGLEPAHFLVFSLWRVTPTEVAAITPSGGASSTLLWTSNLPIAQSGEWSVSFGRVLLPERADVTFSGTEALEVLLCTETPATQVLAEGGVIESFDDDLATIDRANAGVLDAGAAAHIQDASSIDLRTGPDTGGAVWLITISPEIPVATPSA